MSGPTVALPSELAPLPSGEVIELPDDWQVGRVTDGPARPKADAEMQELLRHFAGRDHSIYDTGHSLEVRLVGLTPDEANLIERSSSTEIPFVGRDVPASIAWLDGASLDISQELASTDAIVGVDLETHEIYVSIPPEVDSERARGLQADARRALASRVTPVARRAASDSPGATRGLARSAEVHDLLRFEQGRVQLVDERANPPVKGGRWVNTTAWGCTAGFLMTTSSGSHRFTTAGHCFDGATTSVRMASGAWVGVATSIKPGGWDIAAFTIPSSATTQPAVTVNSAGGYRRVTGSANPSPGTQYCFAGRTSVAEGYDEKCSSNSRTVNYGGKNLYCIERRAHGGDSGGPVYRILSDGSARAAGTAVLDYTIDYPLHPSDHFMCFNRISDVTSALGMNLVVWK